MSVAISPSRREGEGKQSVKVQVNGEARELAENSTVATLLEQLELASRPVAVEVNLEVVPRAQHAEHVLEDADQIEIVTLVGGG
jgi:sulfur carrier protein